MVDDLSSYNGSKVDRIFWNLLLLSSDNWQMSLHSSIAFENFLVFIPTVVLMHNK